MSKAKLIKNDKRIGRRAKSRDGFVGVVSEIWRYPDGYEIFGIKKGSTTHDTKQENITFL